MIFQDLTPWVCDVGGAWLTANLFGGSSVAFYWTLNIPTMPLAAGLTYGAVMNTTIGAAIVASKEENSGGP